MVQTLWKTIWQLLIRLHILLKSVQFSYSVTSDCLWPHALQHARLPCPSPIPGACTNSCLLSRWCHPTILSSVIPFSSCLQSFPASKEKKESEVAQSCLILCNPMDCSPPGFSIHGIFQARVLEWVAISFSRGSSQPRNWTRVSCIAGRHFTIWATRESVLWIRWPKDWSFSFSISSSNEYSGLISFRMDCLDLLAVQGTLKRVFSNTIIEKHQFFSTQLSLWSNSHIHTWLLEKP